MLRGLGWGARRARERARRAGAGGQTTWVARRGTMAGCRAPRVARAAGRARWRGRGRAPRKPRGQKGKIPPRRERGRELARREWTTRRRWLARHKRTTRATRLARLAWRTRTTRRTRQMCPTQPLRRREPARRKTTKPAVVAQARLPPAKTRRPVRFRVSMMPVPVIVCDGKMPCVFGLSCREFLVVGQICYSVC